jgi:hypothetical protein
MHCEDMHTNVLNVDELSRLMNIVKIYKTLLTALVACVIAGSSAQAQEYQTESTTYGHDYTETTHEDGSKTTTYYHKDQNGNLTDEQTVRTRATPAPTPIPAMKKQAIAEETQARNKREQARAKKAQEAYEAHAAAHATPTPEAQATAYVGPTPLSAAEKARLAAEAEADRAPHKHYEFKNGE